MQLIKERHRQLGRKHRQSKGTYKWFEDGKRQITACASY